MLESIASPAEIKKMDVPALSELCDEMREFLIDLLAQRGGHVGPNLGIIEATTALHYVFDSPVDKIIWDVSHQSLPHKLLTGRYGILKDFHLSGGASAFTNPKESEHDSFTVGHTSTSISLAAGLAKARDIKGEMHNVIAVIGDGSLSGGQAFEGLNIAATLKSNFIVLINDNEMSIDFNAGGLYGGLAKLRATNGSHQDNIFKALGYDYRYVQSGNDLSALIDAFAEVKDIKHPVVVHIHTKKGAGLKPAEAHPETWHYHIPFNKTTGESTVNVDKKRALVVSSTETTIDFLLHDQNAYTIIPGSPLLGRTLQEKCPERYLDMGIAEAAGISFGSALALGLRGSDKKPYIVVASTFLQRAYDQVLQDWTLNDAPATLIVLGGAITATDSNHIGIFDIPMLSNVPNLVYLTPTSDKEYVKMLHWCRRQDFPTAIRLSGGNIPELENRDAPEIEGGFSGDDLSIASETISGGVLPTRAFIAKSEVVRNDKNAQVAILGLGMFFHKAQEVSAILDTHKINHALVNPRFISHLDESLLTKIGEECALIVTLEDGITEGGFGQKVATYLSENGSRNFRPQVIVRGADKEHIDSIKYGNLMERYRLTPEQIASDIIDALKQKEVLTN